MQARDLVLQCVRENDKGNVIIALMRFSIPEVLQDKGG